MSSRGQFVGSGPVAGIYQPTPVPREEKDLPAYVNDELLALGGRINSVFEGGAFPPQAEMPKRWRDGMMVYFTEPLKDVYPNTKEQIITSAGVWLFKKSKWWKIIDDPTDLVGGLTYYCLLPDSNPPSTPLTGTTLPPVSPGFTWEEIPPTKPDKTWYIFSTTLVSYVEENNTTTYTWSIPTIWSGGVEDGAPGTPGAPGRQGSVAVSMNITGNAFDELAAYNYILNTIGREIVVWDIVTQTNTSTDFTVTKRVEKEGNPGTWIDFDNIIDGSLIVNGTVHGDAIDAKTRIRIGDLTNPEGDLLVLDATDPNARIWVGSAAPGANARFFVDPGGNMTCRNATINGTLNGIIGADPGAEIQGTAIRVPPNATESRGFYVTADGRMFCESGKFRGTVEASRVEGSRLTRATGSLPTPGTDTGQKLRATSYSNNIAWDDRRTYLANVWTMGVDASTGSINNNTRWGISVDAVVHITAWTGKPQGIKYIKYTPIMMGGVTNMRDANYELFELI